MKQAVCVLLRNGNKFLGVARRDSHSDFGLPGGKMDETDSSLEEAAVRELQEETGLVVNPKSLIKIFERICEGGEGGTDYDCVTFTTDEWTGTPKQGDAGPVEWVTIETLCSGPFGKYNKNLFKSMKRWNNDQVRRD